MICREVVTMAWILLTLLTLAFSGSLGTALLATAQRDCEAANSRLQAEGREGPLAPCQRGEPRP